MSAALLVVLLLAPGQDYDALVALGVAEGKAGRLAESAALFDRALALDPTRPEALVERGGLRFLEGRYDAAARDLGAALRLRDDDYARDLRASALHLAGRWDEALAEWNRLGRPTLRTLTIGGLEKTRDTVARRELLPREGELLRLAEVRRSRLQLREAGAFERVTLRPVPLAGGRADVEVALVERHGLAHGWLDFVVGTGVAAIQGRAPLRYSNVAGQGVAVAAEYRWQENRPQASAVVEWPRPLGLGAYLRVAGFRGRQLYDVEGETLAQRNGFEAGLRRVLGPATVGELRFRLVDRTFDQEHPQAADGRVSGLRARVEHRLVDGNRFTLDAGASAFGASPSLGSQLEFARGLARVSAKTWLLDNDRSALERSALALQVSVGYASAATPFDEAFAPGASPEMELPLRGRRQADDGVLGRTPLVRRLLLGNLEWRKRWVGGGAFQAGTVLFYDGAGLAEGYGGPTGPFHDVGFGVRLVFPGASILRVDVGHGLTDGRTTASIGLGHAF